MFSLAMQSCTITIPLQICTQSLSITDLYHHSPLQIYTNVPSLSIAYLYQYSPLHICSITLHCRYVPSLSITDLQHHSELQICTISLNCQLIQSLSITNLHHHSPLQICTITLHCRSIPSLSFADLYHHSPLQIYNITIHWGSVTSHSVLMASPNNKVIYDVNSCPHIVSSSSQVLIQLEIWLDLIWLIVICIQRWTMSLCIQILKLGFKYESYTDVSLNFTTKQNVAVRLHVLDKLTIFLLSGGGGVEYTPLANFSNCSK